MGSQRIPGRLGPHARAVLLAAALAVPAACSRVEPPVVAAGGETLEGVWTGEEGSVAAFLGVPFAAPPVGLLRWRAPQPHVPRSGIQPADAYAPACVQNGYSVAWYAEVAMAFGHPTDVVAEPVAESEDCLYLNVWTPSLSPPTPLPVLVFVHGGANRGGWSYEPNYVGDRLAARGAVVVTITYRLGPLGFFAHPLIDNGPDEPSANFGLLDIRHALRWVGDHAAAFGGDPERITAIGESSGAGNLIDLALATGDGDPGFVRLIAQSTGGALQGRRDLAAERALGERVVGALSLDGPLSADRLRGVPAGDLFDAADRALPDHYFDAVIDRLTMIRQPLDGLLGGAARDLEILAGTNRDEWLMYLDADARDADVEAWVRAEAPEFAGSVRSIVADATDPRRALDRLHTAKEMLCPTRFLAARASAAGGQGFVYWFTRQRDDGQELGAYHGAELPYVFDRHDLWLPTAEPDRRLTDAIMDYWLSFATDGQPVSGAGPAWPIYTEARPWVMELGDSVRLVEPHDAGLCRYLAPASR